MTSMPSTWAIPLLGQVSDLHWLAYRLCTDDGNSCAGGIAATLGWVQGNCGGPITERDEQPVTLALAHAETWAALRVDDATGSGTGCRAKNPTTPATP